MIIINKPKDFELIEVQCYKCKKIMKVHPMMDSSSSWLVDCKLHNGVELTMSALINMPVSSIIDE